MNGTDDIGTIKDMLRRRVAIPVEEQRLSYAGRLMKEGHAVSDYGLASGSNVRLALRLRGGSGRGLGADQALGRHDAAAAVPMPTSRTVGAGSRGRGHTWRRWTERLVGEVRHIRARGGVPADYTWSAITNPMIWGTSSPELQRQLRDLLTRLGIRHRALLSLEAWWQANGVDTPELAAVALVGVARGYPGVPEAAVQPGPFDYLSPRLQELVVQAAGVDGLLQDDFLNPSPVRAQVINIGSDDSDGDPSSEEF